LKSEKLGGPRRLTSGGLAAGSLISGLCATAVFRLFCKGGRVAGACAGRISGDERLLQCSGMNVASGLVSWALRGG
jgi:hypothetical protein